jgi:putative ribosome biogenesis GTPase RsgA
VFALKRAKSLKRGQNLGVKLPEQFHLRRRQIALRCRAHDCNHTNEPLALPKKEAHAVLAALRRHVSAIEGRFH